MSTYSVYDIKIDNSLAFTPGATAGWVLAIDANGDTYWTEGGAGGGVEEVFQNFWNGTFRERFDGAVTSDGTNVLFTVVNAATSSSDLTMNFSDGASTLVTSPSGATISLTPGSATSLENNYIYVPQSTKVLTVSTSDWPSEEHIKVSFVCLLTAAITQADSGAPLHQDWNDEISDNSDQGHLSHITERSRRMGAIYLSGVDGEGSDDYTTSAAGDVTIQSGSGVLFQMHKHSYPSIDTSGSGHIHVVNAHATDGGTYLETQNLYDITVDTTGSSINNKYFNICLWGAANKSGQYAPLLINIPSGTYTNLADATNDVNGYDVLNIPSQFNNESSTGFLIARLTFRKTGGSWTYYSTLDLRGTKPSNVSGGGAGGTITDFSDNTFTIFNNTDATKIVDIDASGITTGNTRTMTIPDADGTLLTDNKAILADGSVGTPALNFTNDTVSGVYLINSGNIGVSTSGVKRFQFSTSLNTSYLKLKVLSLENDNRIFHTLTDGATITWTYSDGFNAKVTLGGDRNLTITGATSGDYGTLLVTQDGTGTRTITFGANDLFASNTYSFSTGAGDVDIFTWVYDGTDFFWNYNNDFS